MFILFECGVAVHCYESVYNYKNGRSKCKLCFSEKCKLCVPCQCAKLLFSHMPQRISNWCSCLCVEGFLVHSFKPWVEVENCVCRIGTWGTDSSECRSPAVPGCVRASPAWAWQKNIWEKEFCVQRQAVLEDAVVVWIPCFVPLCGTSLPVRNAHLLITHLTFPISDFSD